MGNIKLKKDGMPKKSGGARAGTGPKKAEKKPITKDQAIKALEALGYFIPHLWHLSDVIVAARRIGKPFDSVEDAKKVVAMLLIKFGGENFDSDNQICDYEIECSIRDFFVDRKPYDSLVNF